MSPKRNSDKFHKASTRVLSIVEQHNEVNQFPGGAIFTVLNKFRKKYDVNSKECCRLISSMLLCPREMDNGYVEKYYDINMALLNNGGITLVRKMFFEWEK